MRSEGREHNQPAAHERTVAILGFGELGHACAEALLPFRFRIYGWSRSPRAHPQVECWSGEEGWAHCLRRADILVVLLPATGETRGLLDVRRLASLPAGATLINVGRGAAIDDEALLAALESGALEAAILDVFNEEPLPAGHPYWRHERVWVYPHVAAETDPRSAARVVADTARRFRAGEALPERVDLTRGY